MPREPHDDALDPPGDGAASGLGRMVGGRYRLEEVLGRGGMGVVWGGRDELLHRPVAVKEVVPPRSIDDADRAELRARTLREARAAARISADGVVAIYDVAEDDGRPWIVMERLPARTLEDELSERGGLPPAEVAQIGTTLLAGLVAAHTAGVLHRDVKPSNVMFRERPDGRRAVLADFGIAHFDGDAILTATGVMMGSPAYIAPERARGESATPASDLWSLGVTLWAAVEGWSPFRRVNSLASLTAVITEEVPYPGRAGALLPVLEGLLRKDPADRIDAATARLLLADALPPPGPPTERLGVATTRPLPAPTPAPTPTPTPRPDPTPAPAPAAVVAPAPAVAPVAAVAAAPAAPAAAVASRGPDPTVDAVEAAPVVDPSPRAPERPTFVPPPVRTGVLPVIPAVPLDRSGPAPAVTSSTPAVGTPAPVQQTSPRGAETPAPSSEPPWWTPASLVEEEHPTPRRKARVLPAVVAVAVVAVVGIGTALLQPFDDDAGDPSGASPEVSAPATVPAPAPAADEDAGEADGDAAAAEAEADAGADADEPPASDDQGAAETEPGGDEAQARADEAAGAAGTAQDSTGSAAAAPAAGGDQVPPGFERYADPTGFSVAVPAGWRAEREGPRVYLRDPASRAYLLVDQTDTPAADPVADWQRQEPAVAGRLDNYERLGDIEALDFRGWQAADWEFVFGPGQNTHVLNRNLITAPDQAYALYWSVPSSQWDALLPVHEQVAASFQPAG